jgi:hypothetical protein
MPTLLLLACLLTGGCTGALVQALEEREAASCIWWSTPFGHGVTSTAGTPLAQCLALPCPCQLR